MTLGKGTVPTYTFGGGLMQCFGYGWMDPGFFADPNLGLKVPFRICPFINLCDLNDGFDKVLEKPDQNDSVKSARYEI